MKPPPLSLALLEPAQYKRGLGPVSAGRRALTHLALIDMGGRLTRCYVKAAPPPPPGRPARGLLNEIVGYTLAHHAGVPQPAGGLIRLAAAQLAAVHAGLPADGGDVICFVSAEAHDARDPRTGMARALFGAEHAALCQELTAWPGFATLAAFDTWVANGDRNTGNLIRSAPRQYRVIDHGDILGSAFWLAAELDPHADYPNKLLDLLCSAARLPLPVKSAIVKATEGFWRTWRKAEPELAFWLGGPCNADSLRAWHFLWQRVEISLPLLLRRVELIL